MSVEPDSVWYFAYGSNMCSAIFRERRQMHPLEVRTGCLEGYRLTFDLPVGSGERGVANLIAEPGARTCGILYRLTAEEFERLDRTEGVHLGYYRRLPVEIVVGPEERVSAYTYQSQWSRAGRKPSARYLGLLLDGAREHGLPVDYVAFLECHELALDERPAEIRRS